MLRGPRALPVKVQRAVRDLPRFFVPNRIEWR